MKNLFTPGMQFMLLGTFLFSIGSLFIKMAGEHGVPTMEILFVRGVVGIILCWMIVRKAGIGMFGTRRLTLFTRGLVGFAALFAEFYAIIHLPLADATALLFSNPFVVAILAWVTMGERLDGRSMAGILISIVGVVTVCRPEFLFGAGGGAELDSLALLVALGGVILISIAVITVRSLAKTEHPAVVMLYPPLIITFTSPFFSQGWIVPNLEQMAYLLCVALFMNAGQYYMTRGYAIESAARISGVSCLEIVFAAFWGLTVLDEVPDIWTICGGALIVVGVLALGSGGKKSAPTPNAE